MNDESELWGNGWAFYKSDGANSLIPTVDKCDEWMQGFCTAMADYDPEEDYASIEEALVSMGIVKELLEACLVSAELILNSEEWQRFPSVPVRTQ